MTKEERITRAVAEINKRFRLRTEDFDRIVEAHSLDPDDDDLISKLIDDGWEHVLWEAYKGGFAYMNTNDEPEPPPLLFQEIMRDERR